MRREKMIINDKYLLQEAISHITELEDNDMDITSIFEGWGLTGKEIRALWEEYIDDDAPFRVCDVCGKVMWEGYCMYGGEEYYCSEDCFHTKYTEEEWAEIYEDGGDSYYTEWH